MAASRARCGLSLCARVTRTRCLTNTRALLLDTTRLAKPLSDVSTSGFAATAMKRLNTGQFSTSSLVSSIAANSETEDPGSRPSSVGGGVSAAENEDDDDPFMQEQKRRYNRCLRWLAIIMGENIENFTDKDVQEAIEYLMPSSLYAKDARPLFLHPTVLHKKKKGQVFDVTGRPVSAAFYTGRIGYHDLIFDIYKQFERLESARFNAQNLPASFETTPEDSETTPEDSETTPEDSGTTPEDSETTPEDSETTPEDSGTTPEDSGTTPEDSETTSEDSETTPDDFETTSDDSETDSDGDEVLEKQTTRPLRWIKKIELENRLEETLDDKEYEVVLHRLKKLAAQPDVHLVWDFLEKFVFKVSTPGLKQVPLQLDEQGRAHGIGHRKRAIAEVWIQKGSGHVSVNGLPLVQYLGRIEDRLQILFPFQVVDGVGHYDAECNVIGGGPSGQAGAIRLAISRALLNFSVEFQQPLLEAGLLIRDPRIVERKKPGQKKARKKFAWVKR